MDHRSASNRSLRRVSNQQEPVSNSIRPRRRVSDEPEPVSNSIRHSRPVSNESESVSIRSRQPVPNSLRRHQLASNKPETVSIRSRQPVSNSLRRHQLASNKPESVSILPRQPVSNSLRRHQLASNKPESVSIRPTPVEFVNCYSSHKDKVEEIKRFNKPFLCDGCKERGFKSRYRCKPCNFDLHPECIFAKRTISPKIFHEELVFEFRREAPQPPKEKLCDTCGEKLCDACGEEIRGCFYNCKAKGMDLHPCCATIKAQVRNHDMVLVLCKKASSECLRCRQKESPAPGAKWGTPGWCYVSECKKYNIHIFCITEMLHQAWKEGLMDRTRDNSISNINLDHMAVSQGNRGGKGIDASKIFKTISLLRLVIGPFVGDPSGIVGLLLSPSFAELLQIM